MDLAKERPAQSQNGQTQSVLAGSKNIVNTEVYRKLEEEILWCKEYSKRRMIIDDCATGKTFTARNISQLSPSKGMKNVRTYDYLID